MSTETESHSHGGMQHTHAHGHTAHAHDYEMPELPEAVDIFDTILRDGSQQEGLSLTVDDKLRVAEQLDHLGVSYIEGGWPGANPKDVDSSSGPRKSSTSAPQRSSPSVRRGGPASSRRRTRSWPISSKPARRSPASWPSRGTATWPRRCARHSMRPWPWWPTPSRYLREHDLRVFLDAEHFFDGFRRNPEFALSVLAAAEENGAEALVLCDTNGGTLPDDVGAAVAART